MKKLIAIVGPTATGKSDLGVALARDFDGEIVSADSRQVYRGLNIGTGKITHEEMRGVAHHLLDIADPQERFSVAEYKELAQKVIASIHTRNHVPLLVGGSGMYVSAVIDNKMFPDVPPNQALRHELAEKSTEELFALLQERDPARATTIDPHNPHRLIRALEIVEAVGTVPAQTSSSPYNTLIIGLDLPDTRLRERIHSRLIERLQTGMIEEVARLLDAPPEGIGMTSTRMNELGLEYRYLAKFLEKEITHEEMVAKLDTEIWHYAKRQRTWFKRDKRIKWFQPSEEVSIHNHVTQFLDEEK